MAALTGPIKPKRGALASLPATMEKGELVTTTNAGAERLYVGAAADGTPVQIGGAAVVAASHAAVTLDTNADTLLSLSTQALGLDTQTANYVLSGPVTGSPAVPTFRALVDADIPAALMRDTEHGNDAHTMTIDGVDVSAHAGDAAAHHALVSLDANADTLLSLSTQALGLDTQVKNRVLAGPATGADAVPTFRALTVADVPDTINVRTVTDTTTETATDGLIVCDRGTAMTVNLLAATGSGRGREVASIGVGVVTVDANGVETINGETTQALQQGEAIRIRDYASGKWVII